MVCFISRYTETDQRGFTWGSGWRLADDRIDCFEPSQILSPQLFAFLPYSLHQLLLIPPNAQEPSDKQERLTLKPLMAPDTRPLQCVFVCVRERVNRAQFLVWISRANSSTRAYKLMRTLTLNLVLDVLQLSFWCCDDRPNILNIQKLDKVLLGEMVRWLHIHTRGLHNFAVKHLLSSRYETKVNKNNLVIFC